MAIVAIGQVTITDITDRRVLQVNILSNKGLAQTFSADGATASPNWSAESPFTLTPQAFILGTAQNVIEDCEVKWYSQAADGAKDYFINSPGFVSINPITKELNLFDNFFNTPGVIRFGVEIEYDDPVGAQTLEVDYSVNFLTVRNGASGSDGLDGENAKHVTVTFPLGNVFRNASSSTTLTATGQLYDGGDPVSSYTSKWFYQDSSVNSTGNPNYDADGGLGWSYIKAGNNLSGGLTGFTTQTLTISNAAVSGSRVFKYVGINGTTKASTTFNILDIDDTIQVAIEGNLNFFKGETTSQTLKARLFKADGEITNISAYNFEWSFYDSNDVLLFVHDDNIQTIEYNPSEIGADSGYVVCEVSD